MVVVEGVGAQFHVAPERIVRLFVYGRAGRVDVVARKIAVAAYDGVVRRACQKPVARVMRQPQHPRSVVGHEDTPVSGARAGRFRGESDFRKPPCRDPFGGSVHLRMSFRLEVLVVRGFPVGIDQNIPVRDGGGVPDVLRVEFRPAAAGVSMRRRM